MRRLFLNELQMNLTNLLLVAVVHIVVPSRSLLRSRSRSRRFLRPVRHRAEDVGVVPIDVLFQGERRREPFGAEGASKLQ